MRIFFARIANYPCLMAICAIFVFGTAHAQNNQPHAYRVGMAVNMPFITAYNDTFSARTGFGFWGNAEYKVSEKMRFSPGLAYNNFGYFQNYFNDSGSRLKRKIVEHYFDINGQLSFLPSPSENSARFFIGLGVSLLIERKPDQPDILGRNISQITLDDKKQFSPGLLMSAGFSAPLSKHIDLGLQVLFSQPNKIRPHDITGRLTTLQINLGYKIIPNEVAAKPKKEYSYGGDGWTLPYRPDSLVLVIRLKENKRRIQMLREQGYHIDASEEEQNTLENNLELAKAFKEKFTFLPVYYFYDTDSKDALNGRFEGILLNAEMKRDSSITLPQKQHLFAEFARQFDETTQTSGMYGFVVYDDKFKNLDKPFPAFTSNAYGLLNTGEVITKFQKKLKRYFTPKQ